MTEIHKGYNAEAIEPSREKPNPQDRDDPGTAPPPPIVMIHTRDKGWIKALK
jgi:hypothetical protein